MTNVRKEVNRMDNRIVVENSEIKSAQMETEEGPNRKGRRGWNNEVWGKEEDLHLIPRDRKDIKDELDDVLYGISNDKWLTDVNVLYSKTGEGKKKLGTYKHFKNKVETEDYVLLNIRKKYRRALSMFRAGAAPINIELLRYGVNKTTEEERFCIFCNNTIETECHVLIKCPAYDDIRNELYNNIPDLSFYNISDEHKLYYLLSKKDIV